MCLKMVDEVKHKIDRFDGNDFAYWKMQIEDYLYAKNLHAPMLGTRPADMSDEDWKLLNRKTISLIRPTLAKNVAFNISKCTTTIEVLETLTNMYQKPTATNKVFLMRNLFNLKMSEGAN